MPCEALWDKGVLRIGDVLSAGYQSRLDYEGLLELAREREHQGEAGGAGRNESDRHFAYQFANSAARAVYLCIDPLDALEDVSALIRQFFTDGRVLLIEVPCGAGAGTLGVLSALYEQRRAGRLPTLPLTVDVLGGDVSERAVEHFCWLVERMAPSLKECGVEVAFNSLSWNASDIRSSSRFIDRAVELAEGCDQVFLFVSNFSDALSDDGLTESFQHFLSQFTGRMTGPSAVCWVEPTSNRAERVLSAFDSAIARLAKWLKSSGKKLIEGVRYVFFDPITAKDTNSGVRVLKAVQERLP